MLLKSCYSNIYIYDPNPVTLIGKTFTFKRPTRVLEQLRAQKSYGIQKVVVNRAGGLSTNF